MKNTDKDIDQIIKESLSSEEAQFYDQLGEQNILEMSMGVFQGKNKGIYILTVIISFALFITSIYCCYQAYHAQTAEQIFLYAAIAFWCMIGVMGTKLWHWMQMNTNTILRELKRLELQIATLATKDDSRES